MDAGLSLYMPADMASFRCLAGACRHTCCRGWEIDLDEESVERFRQMPGRLGFRLREAMEEEGGAWHFRLDEQERCPLLRPDGLCDLILEAGEEALCQICRDHPRYVNELPTRVEYGLGLVCEEAARQTVGRAEPMTLVCFGREASGQEADEEDRAAEREMLTFRAWAVSVAQDRSVPFPGRLSRLREAAGMDKGVTPAFLRFLEGLEIMDSRWKEVLEKVRGDFGSFAWTEAMSLPAEQVLVHLLYRHIAPCVYDGRAAERLRFCLLAAETVFRAALALAPLRGKEAWAEAARLFSGEVEYSDENLEACLEEVAF